MIIARTPIRISFFGGGTDYREYYERYPGAVLGTTIDKYVYVSLNRVSEFFDYRIRISYSKSELVNEVSDIIHPSVRECLRYKGFEGFLDVHIYSDLPAKTGLGSSSSFTVGFLHALHALQGRMVPKDLLARDALYVEQQMLKENVGSQDQIHAAFGGLNVIDFDKVGFRVHPVVLPSNNRELLENSTMVFFTGITRFANEVLAEQVRRTKNSDNDRYLTRMYDQVAEAKKVLSYSSGDKMLRELGRLMHEGWLLKQSLSSKVSNKEIGEAYEAAIRGGAYGGKISGAGGGGFMTLIVPPDKKDSVRHALKGSKELKFKFEWEGSTIIYVRD